MTQADFYAAQAAQYGGIAGLGIITAVVMFYYWFAAKFFPSVTRVLFIGAFIGALVILSGRDLAALLPLLAIGWVMRHQIERHPIAFIMLGAVLVRVPALSESLWYDETFTAAVSELSLYRLMRVVMSDVHPPLWYLIEHGVIRVFGSSELALRMPALIFGVLSVYMVYRLALHWRIPHDGAVLAMAFVAVLPAHIYYSNEARAYTLLVCGVLGMLLALPRHSFWFVLAAIVTMFSHNLGFVYAGLIGAAWLALTPRKLATMATLASAAIPGLLWLPALATQAKDIADGFWIAPFSLPSVIAPIVNMTIMGRAGESLSILSGVMFVLFGLGCFYMARHIKTQNLMLVAGLLVPVAVATISLVWRNIYLDRALLPSLVVIAIGAAAQVVSLRKPDKNVLKVIAAPLLVVMLVGFYEHGQRIDSRHLMQSACGNTPAYTTSNTLAFVASYYLPDVRVWDQSNDLNQWLSDDAKAALAWSNELPRRVCLIDGASPLNRPDERAYVADLVANYAITTRLLYKNTFITINTHILEMS